MSELKVYNKLVRVVEGMTYCRAIVIEKRAVAGYEYQVTVKYTKRGGDVMNVSPLVTPTIIRASTEDEAVRLADEQYESSLAEGYKPE